MLNVARFLYCFFIEAVILMTPPRLRTALRTLLIVLLALAGSSADALTWVKLSCLTGPNLTWQKVDSGGGGSTPLAIPANVQNYNLFTALGKAINTNGKTIAWTGGFPTGQVFGAVN